MKRYVYSGVALLLIFTIFIFFTLNNKVSVTDPGKWWGFNCEGSKGAEQSICLTSDAKGLVATKGLLESEKIIFASALLNRSGVRENCHTITHTAADAYFRTHSKISDVREIKYFCQGGVLHGGLSALGSTVSYEKFKELTKNLCKSFDMVPVTKFDCHHGIGHGIGQYDNRSKPIIDLIYKCGEFYSTSQEKSDCATGVMSSLSTNLKGDKIDVARWTNKSCDALVEKYYIESCYKRLPEILFKLKFTLDGIKNVCFKSNNLNACSFGYGWLFADTDPGHSCQDSKLDEKSCISGAIFSLAGRDQIAGKNIDICLKSKEENKNWCREQLTAMYAYELTLPQTKILNLVPEYK